MRRWRPPFWLEQALRWLAVVLLAVAVAWVILAAIGWIWPAFAARRVWWISLGIAVAAAIVIVFRPANRRLRAHQRLVRRRATVGGNSSQPKDMVLDVVGEVGVRMVEGGLRGARGSVPSVNPPPMPQFGAMPDASTPIVDAAVQASSDAAASAATEVAASVATEAASEIGSEAASAAVGAAGEVGAEAVGQAAGAVFEGCFSALVVLAQIASLTVALELAVFLVMSVS